MNIQRSAFIKGYTGMTGIEGFTVFVRFSQLMVWRGSGRRLFLPTPRGPQNRKAWGQLVVFDRIFSVVVMCACRLPYQRSAAGISGPETMNLSITGVKIGRIGLPGSAC